MRRARVRRAHSGRWLAFIFELQPASSPPQAWFPIFYRALPSQAAALAWAISALEEYYLPEPPDA